MSPQPSRYSPNALQDLIALFLRLGFTAFGGPAAHIAMFHDEVVTRRKWLTEQEFLDTLGATNLIPGPNSTEMAIHIGMERAGWRGLLAAGLCFILPAVIIVLGLAWLYVQFGTLPAAEALLYGIKPVVIAVVAQAIAALAPKALRKGLLAAIGAAVFALYFLGVNELLLLFCGGAVMLGRQGALRLRSAAPGVAWLGMPALGVAWAAAVPVALDTLFFTFLKIGSVLYGSGYVLLAFLRNDFVERLGWLTNQQLLDAVAVGQFTPGPVFTTATFVGYLVAGVPGAALATIGIFLPSFVFVALSHPFIPRLRASATAASLLDGVNAGALGLMAAVAVDLGRAAITDWLTALLAIGSGLLLLRWKVNATWLIVGGGLIGLVWRLLFGR